MELSLATHSVRSYELVSFASHGAVQVAGPCEVDQHARELAVRSDVDVNPAILQGHNKGGRGEGGGGVREGEWGRGDGERWVRKQSEFQY